jgi:hypothetical protein
MPTKVWTKEELKEFRTYLLDKKMDGIVMKADTDPKKVFPVLSLALIEKVEGTEER